MLGETGEIIRAVGARALPPSIAIGTPETLGGAWVGVHAFWTSGAGSSCSIGNGTGWTHVAFR